MSDFYPERGAGELQRFLQEKRAELQSVNAELQRAHDVLEDTQDRWEALYDEVVEQMEEESAGKQLPGEELRISRTRRSGGREAWVNYRRASRMVKRLEKRGTLIANQISAAQSEAKLGGVV